MSKTCNKCHNTFMLDSFNRDNKSKDGHKNSCKDCSRDNYKIYYQSNKHITKAYYMNNKQKIIECNMNNNNKRYQDDHKFKEIMNKRCSINHHIKQKTDCKYLGIPMDIYYKWMEFNFDDQMTWDNRGTYWQIDHTIPPQMCDEIDAFHWSNTYPMIKSKNISKGNGIDIGTCLQRQQKVNEFKLLHRI